MCGSTQGVNYRRLRVGTRCDVCVWNWAANVQEGLSMPSLGREVAALHGEHCYKCCAVQV
jgi:hypothetical protein